MTTTTFAELNNNRRKWIQKDPLRVDNFSDLAIQAGGIETIQRVFAFALFAELPVKDFVLMSNPKELPISENAKKCLLNNAGDEDRHYHAFLKAEQSYHVPERFKAIAKDLIKCFIEALDHPIEIAGFLETGMFQLSLTLMRVLGTPAIVSLGAKVSEDERRHQITNRAIMRSLGYDPTQPSQNLIQLKADVLAWLLEDLRDSEALGLFKDDLIDSSNQLIRTGNDEYLTFLTQGAEYMLPFENANSALY